MSLSFRSPLRGALLVTLFLARPGFGQSPSTDYLPLAVGNSWTYDYVVQDDRLQGDEFLSDTGRATYTVLSRVATADSIIWTFKEVRNVRHFYSFFFDHSRDTNYLVNDSTTFDVVEDLEGNHKLARVDRFQDCWKSVFAFASDAAVFSDSAGGFIRFRTALLADTLGVSAGDAPMDPGSTPIHNARITWERATGIREISFWTEHITGLAERTHHKLLQATVTAIDNGDATLMVTEFQLLQNFPNPFNPSTTIPYTLPRSSHVTLALCNVLGQQVATLVDDRILAGYHEVIFDGSGLPSGVYFCRLSTEGFVQTKRLVLLR